MRAVLETKKVMTHFCGLVFAGSDKVTAIGAQLEVGDLFSMGALIGFHLVAGLGIPKRYLAALVASKDDVSRVTERANGRLRARRVELGNRNMRLLCSITGTVEVEYADRPLVSHALLGNAYNLRIVFAESNSLYSGRELPRKQTFAVGDVPQTHSVVGSSSNDIFGFG